MVPPTEVDEEQEDDADEKASPTRNRRGPLVAVLVAFVVVFGLAASVVTASYVRLRSDRDSADSDRTKVATTASQVAEAMTAIDANDQNQQQADVIHALGTGPLIDQYDEAIPATRKLLVALGVQSEHGQVPPANGIYIGDIENNQAQVLVVIDLVVVGQVVKTVPNQYLRVHLVKLDGVWKVDNVENLNVALAASADSSGASTTSTATTLPDTSSSSSGG